MEWNGRLKLVNDFTASAAVSPSALAAASLAEVFASPRAKLDDLFK
jgi:hypothetical protein